jgi:predicted ATPase
MLHQTAYNMIPDTKRRAQVHLRTGRRLWKHSSLKDGLDDVDMLFMVAQQLQQGIELVSDATERSMIVGIHWEAGKKAMAAGAFATAASYFDFAISLLKDTIWSAETYDISLALCNGAAEAYFSSGDLASMDRMLDAVFHHANSLDDKLQAYTTSVFANGSRGRFREAVATAFDVLGQLGEPLSLNPSTVQVWLAHCKLRRLFRGKGTRFFTNLPIATNANKIAAMTLLNFAVMYAYPFKRPCSDLATFSLIQLATRHGITNAAAFAISAYGVMMVNRHGRFEVGYRYGQIAVELLGRLESRAWLSRVYFMVS